VFPALRIADKCRVAQNAFAYGAIFKQLNCFLLNPNAAELLERQGHECKGEGAIRGGVLRPLKGGHWGVRESG